jgi:aryl-alcohol dehydrogenase-like predicted oxidoreductase
MSQTTATLPAREFTRGGPRVPIVGFGAEALGRKGRLLADAERTLHAVVDAGVTLIDTASSYGNSERFVGAALASRRDEITIVTKCGWSEALEPRWTAAEIAATVEASLEALRTDRIDVLLLHSCPLETLERGEAIEAIERLRRAGKARFIGYSGDNEALAYAVASGRFDAIETTLNILDRANAPTIVSAAERGMAVLAKRPIANAVPGRTERPRSEYAAQYWSRWEAFAPRCERRDDAAWREIAMRFTAHAEGVTSALVGSSHAAHVIEIARAASDGRLPQATLAALDSAYERVGSSWPALG